MAQVHFECSRLRGAKHVALQLFSLQVVIETRVLPATPKFKLKKTIVTPTYHDDSNAKTWIRHFFYTIPRVVSIQPKELKDKN